MTFTVNARTDPYLEGHPEPFAEVGARERGGAQEGELTGQP